MERSVIIRKMKREYVTDENDHMSLSETTEWEYDSWDDWGAILTEFEDALPSPKTNYVQIEGRSDVIDLSAIGGQVGYNQRTVTMGFDISFDPSEYQDKINWFYSLLGKIQGADVELVGPDDKEDTYWYLGRVTVSDFERGQNYITFKMKINCDPYRYSEYKTGNIPSDDTFWRGVISYSPIGKCYPTLVITGNQSQLPTTYWSIKVSCLSGNIDDKSSVIRRPRELFNTPYVGQELFFNGIGGERSVPWAIDVLDSDESVVVDHGDTDISKRYGIEATFYWREHKI